MVTPTFFKMEICHKQMMLDGKHYALVHNYVNVPDVDNCFKQKCRRCGLINFVRRLK